MYTELDMDTSDQEQIIAMTIESVLPLCIIVFQIEEVLVNETDERISLIEGEKAEVSVPREVWSGLSESDRVRVAFLLFRNVSGLLPEHLPSEENTT